MAHIGRRNTIGVAIEQTPGTVEAPKFYIPYLECNLQEKHTPIAETQARGVRDMEGEGVVEGKKWGEGSLDVVLDPTTAPLWFALALGEINSTGAGPYYDHAITRAANDPLTATIWRGRVIDQMNFLNSVVNSLELNFADDVAKLSIDLLSKYPVTQARTPSVEELDYYTFKDATVKVGSLADAKIREITLNIENNAEALHAPGDNDVNEIVWKGFRVSGEFSLKFENTTHRDAFRDLDKQDLVITFEGPDDEEIVITIPKFRVNDWGLENPNDDLVLENISFVGEYDEVTEETINVAIHNKVEKFVEGS